MIKRTRIADNVFFIEPGKTDYPASSAGIVISSTPKIFIDINAGPEQTRNLLDSEKPDIVIVSHYHLDHSIIGSWVQANSNIELMIPDGEENYLTSMEYFNKNTKGSYGNDEKWMYFINNLIKYEKIEQFSLHDRETKIRSGKVTVQCIPGAGHSPAHTAFYFPEHGALFACDIGLGPFGPWYGWVDCDITAYIESILHLRSLKAHVIMTCHNGIFEKNIEDVLNRCLGHFFKREKMIVESLDQGKTKDEIVEAGICFLNKSGVQEPFRTFLYMWDSIMFDHHVKMIDNGTLGKAFPGFLQYSSFV